MVKKLITLLLLFIIIFRVLLLSPAFLELVLHHERKIQNQHLCSEQQQTSCSLGSKKFTSSLPWSSINQLKEQHGDGATLSGTKVRDLYKNTLVEGKIFNWVESTLKATDKNEVSGNNDYVATSCSKMRWQARLYSRSRHELHPFSTEYLGLRDAFVHGLKKKSWRNFVACIAQNEEYPCPGVADHVLNSAEEEENDKKKKWSDKVLTSCRKSNEFYDSMLGADKKKPKANEDL